MSVERVLAAAAALRYFTVAELAAFCDEQPPAIVVILQAAGEHVEQLEDAADPSGGRWRVVDLEGLRRDLAARARTSRLDQRLNQPRHGSAESHRGRAALPATRLLLAEQMLSECAVVDSVAERRILIATAKNHLRQVIASTLPRRHPWWSVEFSLRRLDEAIGWEPDQVASTRLGLNVALVCLAEHDAVGWPVPTRDLVATVRRFEQLIAVLEEPQLHDLVGRFFDLVMAHLVPKDRNSVPASDRLIAAVARRRVRAQVEHGVGTAMHALVPLLTSLSRERRRIDRKQGLYRVLGHLSDGRDRVAVYADLLQLLPRQFAWHAATELLPGALVEAITEPAATARLARCAEEVEHDLARSPFGSDAALIGQVAHIFQDLADQEAVLDDTVRTRSDHTRSELLTLAKAPVWHPASTPLGT